MPCGEEKLGKRQINTVVLAVKFTMKNGGKQGQRNVPMAKPPIQNNPRKTFNTLLQAKARFVSKGPWPRPRVPIQSFMTRQVAPPPAPVVKKETVRQLEVRRDLIVKAEDVQLEQKDQEPETVMRKPRIKKVCSD